MSEFFPEHITVKMTAEMKRRVKDHVGIYGLWNSDSDVVRSAINHFFLCEEGAVNRLEEAKKEEVKKHERNRLYRN